MIRRNRWHVRGLRLAVAGLMTVGTGLVAFSGTSNADVSTVKGSAYGYQLNVTLFGGPVNKRGAVQDTCTAPNTPPGCTSTPSVSSSPSVTLPSAGGNVPATDADGTTGQVGPAVFFSSGQIDVRTQGTTGVGGSVTSTTNIANVNRSQSESFGQQELTQPRTSIASTCTASETGVSGSVTVTNGIVYTDNGLDVNGNNNFTDPGDHPPVTVPVPTNPGPGTSFSGHIEVNGQQDFFRYVFNEQTTNPDGSLTVYAFHQYLIGPTAVGDLFVGKVECGITAIAGTTTTTRPATTTTTRPATTTTVASATTTTVAGNTTTTVPGTATTTTVAGNTTTTTRSSTTTTTTSNTTTTIKHLPKRCANPTLVGTSGNDVLVGTPGPDVIDGRGGNDIIVGRAGDDLLCGGSGDDLIAGGPGRDRLVGGAGHDRCFGGSGTDSATTCELQSSIP